MKIGHGCDRDRPAFNKMIKDAQENKFHVILCKDQTRFARDLSIIEHYLHCKFIEWGIRFMGITDHADTDDKYNKTARQINGITAETYCSNTSESVKAILKQKQRNGDYIGSFALYGYRKDPENKNHLLIDEEVSNTVKKIFKLYLRGKGIHKIADILNDAGVESPATYKRRTTLYVHPMAHTGLWHHTSILKILKNEMYIGNMVQGYTNKLSYKLKKSQKIPSKDWIIKENTHEGIIKKKDFYKVQDIIAGRHRKATKTGEIHPFSGKIICADCGQTMYKKTYGFRCKTHELYKTCSSHSISFKNLEKEVLLQTKAHIKEFSDIDKLADNLTLHDFEQKRILLKKQIQDISSKIEQSDYKFVSKYKAYENGILTERQFQIVSKAQEKEIEDYTILKKNLTNKLQSLPDHEKVVKKKKELAEKYKNLQELTSESVQELIDVVRVCEKDEQKNQPLHIKWNF